MEIEAAVQLLRDQFINNLQAEPAGGGWSISLPFTDPLGDPVELLATPTETGIIFDDLGHTASILFHLGQNVEDTPGYMLTRNLSESYGVYVNYDEGVLSWEMTSEQEASRLLNFIKVLISLQTAVPEMQHRRKERRKGTRLDTRLREVVTQLRLPEYVKRQEEVAGKHDYWIVNYKYSHKQFDNPIEVLIATANLHVRVPQQQAAHILTMAEDVLSTRDDGDRVFRVVYDMNGNGNVQAAQRAAALITDHQNKGYQAFNFGDSREREHFISLTNQELSPLIRNSG